MINFATILGGLTVVVTALLYGGVADKSSFRLIVAWISGVLALNVLGWFVILLRLRDWDDPSSGRWGSLGDPIVAIAIILLSIAFALFIRRRAVVYLAAVISPFMAWYYYWGLFT